MSRAWISRTARRGLIPVTGDTPPAGDWRRFDERLLDPAGAAAVVSVVWPDRDALIAFDDLAVQHARRRVLAEAPADAVSTLLIDDRRFAGAITVRRGPGAAAALEDDPFARLGPRTIFSIPAGLLGVSPAPTGPTIERHGSAQPWPWDRF